MKLLNVDVVVCPEVEGTAMYHLGKQVFYMEGLDDLIGFLHKNVVHVAGLYRADLSAVTPEYEYPYTLSQIPSLVRLNP